MINHKLTENNNGVVYIIDNMRHSILYTKLAVMTMVIETMVDAAQ